MFSALSARPASLVPPPLRRTQWLYWGLATLLFALVTALAAAPPFAPPAAAEFIRQAFSGLCHQIPERSPHLGGAPWAVCHRCAGIYAGLTAGAALYPLLRRWPLAARPLLLAALGLAAADWLLGAAGLWANTPASRVLTGFLFGAVAGALVVQSLVRLCRPPGAEGAS